MSYRNFKAALYCPVGNLLPLTDLQAFEKEFARLEKHVRISKVYLETYRSGRRIERAQMEALKAFFQSRGIATSGGITTDSPEKGDGGFHSLCYTNPKHRALLQEVVVMTASLFDEIILDDFYFTNCRCASCIAEKGDRSWWHFRVDLMREVSESLVVGTAKRVNPGVSMIIKYPNWYEHYQDTGYNLKEEPGIFDAIYTGTETRNPTYTQQHLPKYLSYFLMRYLENTAPGRNGGGWFDPYECSYNLTSYADQGYLTLFAKAREATLFSLGSLLEKEYSLFPPVAGQVFQDMDEVMGELGNPVGTACYLPYHAHGEDFLHNYAGMLGIPLEPYPAYPAQASKIFLTESAALDPEIIEKVRQSLMSGADVIVTSGFVKAARGKLEDFTKVVYTGRKASVNRFACSFNGGINFGACEFADKSILLPQLEYPTNDTWELAAAFGEDNSFPILLKTNYGGGRLFVLTIPDDMGDLYHYPQRVLKSVREVFQTGPVLLDGSAKHTLFVYDNDTFIMRSFLPYHDTITFVVKGEDAVLENLVTGKRETGINKKGNTCFDQVSTPGASRFYRILHKSDL